MSETPEDFLELSRQALEDLEIAWEGGASLRTLYNRLYYGVFYAAKEGLLSKGIETKTHRGTANPKLITQKEFEKKSDYSFFKQIQEEGIPIYG